MRVARLLLASGSFFDAKCFQLDQNGSQGADERTWSLSGAPDSGSDQRSVRELARELHRFAPDILHVYGTGLVPHAVVNATGVPWLADRRLKVSRSLLGQRPRAQSKVLIEEIAEPVANDFFVPRSPRAIDRAPRVGSLRQSAKTVSYRDLVDARIRRFRDDVEWTLYDTLPGVAAMETLDLWVDLAADDNELDGLVGEALALGLPVVASRTGANRRRSGDGRGAALSPVGDHNEMAHAIVTMLFKPERAAPIRAAAAELRGMLSPGAETRRSACSVCGGGRVSLDLARLEEHRATLDAIGEAARRAGARAFLVGGPVRDLFLNGVIRDVDIAIEGDASATVRFFAEAKGLKSRAIEAFLTFKVTIGEQHDIDIATTRRERYAHPGALPLVEPASIEEDLGRRDFSINAIAIEIGRWSVVDPTDGMADLERRTLRALHPASFIDDPTRILRGLRFAHARSLTWQRETERWLHAAIDADALSTVSRERIWRELLRAANEPRREGTALLAIARSGALERVLGIPREPREAAAIASLHRVGERMFENGPADGPLLRIALLFAGAPVNADGLRGAPMGDSQKGEILSLAGDPRRFSKQLAALTDDGSKFDAIEAMLPNERVLSVVFDASLESFVTRYVEAWLTTPGVRGNELGVPPGPWIGKAFRATRKAIFTRAITSGEAAAFARRAALDYLREQDRKE